MTDGESTFYEMAANDFYETIVSVRKEVEGFESDEDAKALYERLKNVWALVKTARKASL